MFLKEDVVINDVLPLIGNIMKTNLTLEKSVEDAVRIIPSSLNGCGLSSTLTQISSVDDSLKSSVANISDSISSVKKIESRSNSILYSMLGGFCAASNIFYDDVGVGSLAMHHYLTMTFRP